MYQLIHLINVTKRFVDFVAEGLLLLVVMCLLINFSHLMRMAISTQMN